MRAPILPPLAITLFGFAACAYACGSNQEASSGIATGEDGGPGVAPSGAEGNVTGSSDGAPNGDAGQASTPVDGEAPAPNDASPIDASDGAIDDGGLVDPPADAAADAAEDPGPPAVRFVGRWDTRDPGGPRAAWPGSRVLANFEGPSVSVTLSETTGFSGGPSVYDVILDGALRPEGPLFTDVGQKTYLLAENLGAGPHSVELYKRTETSFGVTKFGGFDFGVGGVLLPPPKAAARRIEFLGNSTTVGFGVEGQGPNCDGGAPRETHNAHVALMGLVGKDLAADVFGIGYSGKGIVQNESAADMRTFLNIYPRALADDVTSAWDFSKFTPDVVFVMIGGTDFSLQRAGFVPTPYATFIPKFIGLFDDVRAHYPNAHVFCAVSPQAKDNVPAGTAARTNLRNACADVLAHRATFGDVAFHYFEFDESFTNETGCYYHPNTTLTRQMADKLEPVLKTTLGW